MRTLPIRTLPLCWILVACGRGGGGSPSAAPGGPAAPADPRTPEGAATPADRPAEVEATRAYAPVHLGREGVLGTSMDLIVVGGGVPVAERVQEVVLDEVAHREEIISTWRADSELARINATPWQPDQEIRLSGSLGLLLSEAHRLQRTTRGAFNPYLGEVLDLYAEGTAPDPAALAAAVKRAGHGFHVKRRKKKRYLIRDEPGRFALDAIGKGYVIDKAIREARQAVPEATAGSLDIGGDLRVWGDRDFVVDVADPRRPEDNAAPLARVSLRNLAIATSGDYARPRTVDGVPASHIIDPRTGLPVSGVLQATVVAPTARMADALATALMVLGPDEGIPIIEEETPAFALLVTDDGAVHRSRGWSVLERPLEEPAQFEAPTAGPPWPEGYAVTIDFDLVNSWETDPPKGRTHDFERHFLAAWVEDAAGRPVRTLAVWAKEDDIEYVEYLDSFYKYGWLLSGGGEDTDPLIPVSRATRNPGHYSLRWDGRDAVGRAVPQGDYTLYLDINREHGPPDGHAEHTVAALPLHCGDGPADVAAPDQPELQGVVAHYGPGIR